MAKFRLPSRNTRPVLWTGKTLTSTSDTSDYCSAEAMSSKASSNNIDGHEIIQLGYEW